MKKKNKRIKQQLFRDVLLKIISPVSLKKRRLLLFFIVLFLFNHIFVLKLTSEIIEKKLVYDLGAWDSVVSCSLSITNRETNSYIKIKSDRKKQFYVINGIRGEQYDDIMMDTLNTSPHYLAYWGRNYSQWYIIFNNKKIPAGFNKPSPLTLSPDGKRWACIFFENGNYYIFKNNERYIRNLNELRILTFSPNGEDIYYTSGIKGLQYLMVNKETITDRYDYIGEARFAPDGRLIYWAMKEKTIYIFKNHFKIASLFCPDRSYAEYMTLSNDGDLAYKRNVKPYELVVRNGEEGNHYRNISGLTFSPDGTHLAYIAGVFPDDNKHESFLLMDSSPGKKYYFIDNRLVFSPDSKNIVYRAGNLEGKEIVVKDENEYIIERGVAKDWGFVLTGDKYEYYAGILDTVLNMEYIILGGKQGGYFHKIFKGVYFNIEGNYLIYLAQEYNKIYRIKERFK